MAVTLNVALARKVCLLLIEKDNAEIALGLH